MTTRRKTPQECVSTRSYNLTNAIAAARPVVIGHALVQGELISQNVVSMANLTPFQQASDILNAVSSHIIVDPEAALKKFIKVLLKTEDFALKKIAKEMAQESKNYIRIMLLHPCECNIQFTSTTYALHERGCHNEFLHPCECNIQFTSTTYALHERGCHNEFFPMKPYYSY